MEDRLLRYLAWWVRWRTRSAALPDDEARLKLTWEAEDELRAMLAETQERDMNGTLIDGP